MITSESYESLQTQLDELRIKVQEANEVIEAIRSGEIDALVVKKEDQHQLYTLKTADHTYRVFIEKMKEGAVTLNPEGIILYSNSQFATLIDATLTEVIGQPITNFIPAKLHDLFKKIILKGWQSDSKGEIFFKNKKDELIPFQISVTTLELDSGPALIVILTDLTAQKETEKQLQLQNEQLEQARQKVAKMNEELENTVKERTRDLFMSREYFKFLADNIPVIVWATKANGEIDYFNKQWFEYTGLDFEQSKDRRTKVLHPDDLELVETEWSKAISNQTSFQFEYRIKRALDGRYRWHLAKGEPLKDRSGNLIAWFGTSADIEDKMKELEKKDEFISIASHELKTPLTSLKGYLELIGESELQEPVDSYVEKANASLNKLQHLISDLLDTSKIKEGKLKFETTVFNISDLVKNCIENCKLIYPSFKITNQIEENILVRGNEEHLEQVLMNLVNNAVKYSLEKKEIIISIEKQDQIAKVSVTDFGIGLSSADQTKVFDRFYRVENNGTHTPGLGMGLYIASGIIKQHNGTLSIISELRKGSTFSFSLPLAEPE